MLQQCVQLVGRLLPECLAGGCFCPFRQKEMYPSYIKRSNEEFRVRRSTVLYALLAKNFRTLLSTQGLSMEEAAQKMDLPLNLLQQLDEGRLIVTCSILVKMGDCFGVKIDFLVDRDLSLAR